ncbi:vitamin K epoxide reductase family protein [Desulfobacterium sp. N47]|uniref:Vitamin K epoxide reductase domain-containing protein n=1 Tax=uncultured Desulfobacterium sp. TaxID=201089 RepID=E1YCV2_9BACT|nr:hypothetical protein N47_G37200 [uncultured Desulfobacterium sp.]
MTIAVSQTGRKQTINTKWAAAFISLLLIGIVNSGYLTYHHHYINIIQPTTKSFCAINETFDCDKVAKSDASRFMGIPVATLGLFAHLFVLLFLLNAHIFRIKALKAAYTYISLMLFIMALFCAYEAIISFVVLKAICIMCSILYIIDAIVLYLCVYILKKNNVLILKEFFGKTSPLLAWRVLKTWIVAIFMSLFIAAYTSFAFDFGTQKRFTNMRNKQIMERMINEDTTDTSSHRID